MNIDVFKSTKLLSLLLRHTSLYCINFSNVILKVRVKTAKKKEKTHAFLAFLIFLSLLLFSLICCYILRYKKKHVCVHTSKRK